MSELTEADPPRDGLIRAQSLRDDLEEARREVEFQRERAESAEQQLASSQARESQMREALENAVVAPHAVGTKLLCLAALALPADRKALDAALAEARKEGMLEAAERCDPSEEGGEAWKAGMLEAAELAAAQYEIEVPAMDAGNQSDCYRTGYSNGCIDAFNAIRQAAEGEKGSSHENHR